MPERRRPTPRTVTVLRAERLSDSLRRVVVGGPSLAGFTPGHADAYVKLVFPPADGAPADRPRMRTYTVRAFDAEALELTLDFVVHGDEGLAGPWADAARPGDEIDLLGPGGGYSPSPDAAWHLLAGDESALPAVAAVLEHVRGPVRVFLEVHGPGDEIPLPAVPGAVVTWLHRGDAPVGSALVDAVTGWTPPGGDGEWFVHGEAAAVRELRRHLRVGLGVPLERMSISGYWRLGVDDEGWRAVKRDWNQAIEDAEQVVA